MNRLETDFPFTVVIVEAVAGWYVQTFTMASADRLWKLLLTKCMEAHARI